MSRFFCSAFVWAVLTACWPLVSLADAKAPQRASFLVELRINSSATSSDFYDLMRDAAGRVFVPAAAIFELGEASAAADDTGLRLEVLSTQQSMRVNLLAKTLVVNAKPQRFDAEDFIVSDKVLLVNKALLEAAFDIELDFSEENQRLNVISNKPWPIDLRMARERSWGRLLNQQEELGIPSVDVRQDYALWGAPQADVALGQSGKNLSHSALVVGELGYLTTQLFLAGSNGNITSSRIQAGRVDPEGRAFGIPGLYDLQAGDIQPLRLPLIGSGPAGRGISFSGNPLNRPVNFDTTVITGDALPGWDAELMLGQSVLDFMRVGADGRYQFQNIPLTYGANSLRVVLSGPQGQSRELLFQQTVSGDMVPVGKLYTRGYLLQNPSTRSVAAGSASLQATGYSGALAVDYGLSKALTTGFFLAQLPDALAQTGSYAGFNLRTALKGVAAAFTYTGQQGPAVSSTARATQLALAGALGGLSLNVAQERYTKGFHSAANQNGLVSGLTKLRLSTPLAWPFSVATNAGIAARNYGSVSIGLDRTVQQSGGIVLTPSLLLSHAVGVAALSHQLIYNIQTAPHSVAQRDANYRLLGYLARGDFNLRGSIDARVTPSPGWKAAAVSGTYLDDFDVWNANINFAAASLSPSANWSRNFGWGYLSVGGGWSKGSGLAVSTSLNFTLSGTGRGSLQMSSLHKANQGQADIEVYQQPFADAGERAGATRIAAAQLNINRAATSQLTDAYGRVKLNGLATTDATVVSIDQDTLPDIFLVPLQPSLRFWPRAGQSIHLQIPVTESGEISGRLALDGQRGLVGFRLQALDEQGRLHSETRTLNDGYFMFDKVYAGTWVVKLAPNQSWRSKPFANVSSRVTLTPGELQVSNVELNVRALP